MKRIAVFSAVLTAAALSCAGALTDTEVNLLRTGTLEPAVIHGKVTGVRGWPMRDYARDKYISPLRGYFSGEDCFKVDVQDGVATLSFPDSLPAPYKGKPGESIHIYLGVDPQPPCSAFHITGRVKLDKGALRLNTGPAFKPAPEWQQIDYTGRPFFVAITPAAGAKISFGAFKMTPVYPKVGGEIALPDGGKLTHFLLARDADFTTRWGVAMWRGWLWKLTGVALPIVTVDKVEPAAGAFAAVMDSSLERGWHLQVGRSGITLRHREEDDLAPALFDYLRMALGYAFYGPGCEKLPKLPVAELPAIDRRAKPRYRAMLQSSQYPLFSGGKIRPLRYVCNDGNYYHLNYPDWIHVLGTAIPQEVYYKNHPEYFMMDASGKRVVSYRPSFTHQCFSNPGARQVMLDGLSDIAKMQRGLHNMCFEPGDTESFCLCPKCVAFNGTKKTNIDLLMDFTNEAARALKAIDPKFRIFRCAYLNRCYPPKKVKVADNIDIFFCLTEHLLPCTLHTDCARNQEGLKMLAGWHKALGGDSARLGFMTYDDARPLQYVRMAEYFNKYASGDFYMFNWHYTPNAVNFVLPRWNLGEDADKLMEEYDSHYYGKAGKAMHKITRFIDEYARNYRHTGNEGKLTVLFCGHQRHVASVFDRATLDKLYKLFDEAVAAAGDDKAVRARIFEEKKCVLAEDFIKFGPATCATDAALDAFVKRLVDFITMAREAPGRFGRVSADQDTRSFLLATTGLAIPDTGKFWAKEPFIDKFLADPKSYFSSADRIPGGRYFKPLAMRGADAPAVYSYECPARYCVALRRAPDADPTATAGYAPAGAGNAPDRSRATITMNLDYAPKSASFLAVEGQDDDKPGASTMSVSVNGKTIYSGPNRFPERAWGRMGLTIPAGALKKGVNTIAIANTTPNTPARSARFTDPKLAAQDPQWGWILISEAYWLDPNDDFARFLKKTPDTVWCFTDGNQRATPVVRDGRAVLPGGEMGPAYYCGHLTPKLALTPGSRVKLTVRAAGKGTLRLGLWNYTPYPVGPGITLPSGGFAGVRTKLLKRSVSKPFQLSAKPQSFGCVLTPPKETGMIIPRIFMDKNGEAEVTDFRMELLPPAGTRK